jgi:predicted transcriptional regulator
MSVKLFDSELRVMKVLWENGDLTAKEISKLLKESVGWNQNTTYTVIKKCIAKGAIERSEPNFLCHPLISENEAQLSSTTELVDKMFGGSSELLFASLLNNDRFSKKEIDNLRQMIADYEKK